MPVLQDINMSVKKEADMLPVAPSPGMTTRSLASRETSQELDTKKGGKKAESIHCSECNKVISSKERLKTHLKQVHRVEKPYTCWICYKSFPQRTSLRIHLNIHSGEKPHTCKFCNKSFRGKSNLNRHLRIHTMEKPYSCSYCDRKFSDPGNLKVHTNYHTKTKNFKCNKCDKSFYQNTQLKQHLKTHTHQPDTLGFVCNICGQVYNKEGYLRRHIKAHSIKNDVSNECNSSSHEQKDVAPNAAYLDDHDIPANATNTPAQDSAPLSINGEVVVGSHVNMESTAGQISIAEGQDHPTENQHGSEPDSHVAEDVVGSDATEVNGGKQSSYKGKKVKCLKCHKILSSRASLTMHLRIHIGEKRYSCNMCDKKFNQRTSLIVHQRIHKGEKPHACTSCSKAFASKANLIRHLRIHTKEKPYSCPHCNKKFGESGNLKVHLRSHTNTKPYQCEVCSKLFYQYAHLKQHLKTHNKDKIFSCEICDRKFSRIGYLERHKRVHKKGKQKKIHKCQICGKQLSRSTHLRRHMRVHDKDSTVEKGINGVSDEKVNKRKAEGQTDGQGNQNKGVLEKITTQSNLSDDDVGVEVSPSLPTGPVQAAQQRSADLSQENIQLNAVNQTLALHAPDLTRLPMPQNLTPNFQDAYRLHSHSTLFSNMQPPHSLQPAPTLHGYPEILPQRNMQVLPTQRSLQTLTQPQRPLACDTCGLQFSRPALLKKHRKTHSNVVSSELQTFHAVPNGYNDPELNTYNQFAHLPNLQQTFRCDVCNTTTNDLSDLWAHFQVHSGQMRALEAKLTAHSL